MLPGYTRRFGADQARAGDPSSAADLNREPDWPDIAVSGGSFLLLLILERYLPAQGAALLWMAWSLYATWRQGPLVAAGMITVLLTFNAVRFPPESLAQTGVLLLVWCVYLGVIFWVATLRRRLRTEYRLARQDPLTGLANRQEILERCQAELCRAQRFQRPLTIVLLDGDSFKSINDQYGHPTGDLVLCRAATALSESVRQYDLVGRLGGDEFVILLPEVAQDEAQMIVKRLQTGLETHVERLHPPLTFSMGVVTVPPGAWEIAACLAAADRALYGAKGAGKNRVHFETLVLSTAAATGQEYSHD